jgi:hypothetical protein
MMLRRVLLGPVAPLPVVAGVIALARGGPGRGPPAEEPIGRGVIEEAERIGRRIAEWEAPRKAGVGGNDGPGLRCEVRATSSI